jgi:UDP-N-acetylmuramoylalanine--D-glutamate ligase
MLVAMNDVSSLNNKRVLVIGLGLHGGALGTITWLAKQGAIISVSDTKTQEQLANSVEKLRDLSGITYHFGNQDELNLIGIEMIIRNPGVPRTAPILIRAREMNIPIEMDSSLFFAYSPSIHIIGITGSKGKTTTSTAIAHVLKSINPKTVAVGIDGVSPLGMVSTVQEESPVVFELSSWRLEALQEKQVSPHIAVVTSLYRDHLNTYASFEEYLNTKKQIIRNQTENDIAILNADDERIRGWSSDVVGKTYWYSLKPLPQDEQGAWVDGDDVFAQIDSERIRICSISDIPHTSPHELRNKLPSLIIALLEGVDLPAIAQALTSIPALAHRLQLVRTVSGVAYINDSAATMPDATIAALKSFSEKPLILIIGGSDKALEFQELSQEISTHHHIKRLIWLPGTATDRMKEEILSKTNTISHNTASMEEAVQVASQYATEGDTVLLSPGATSFGLFLHEFDRGDSFIRAVEQL